MSLIRDDRDQFGRLVTATAERMNLDPALIEKDYWAVESLRAVRNGLEVSIDGGEVRVQPIFKGGTSLSKAHGLIERFSEDVDLLVPIPADDPLSYSQAQRTELLRATTEAVSEVLGIEGERKGGRRGVDRHWLYPYEPVAGRPELVGVQPSIRVEVTVMGGASPRTTQRVTAFVADHAEALEDFPAYDDLAPVEIETLAPERTLVEKLAMIHDAAEQAVVGNTNRLQGAGRHYYDIAMLLRSDSVASALSPDWVAETAADADRWSSMGKYPFTSRPDAGFAASPAFRDASLAGIVSTSYQTALTWVWGDKPTLEDCIEVVEAHAHLL